MGLDIGKEMHQKAIMLISCVCACVCVCVCVAEDEQQARWRLDHGPSHQTADWHGLPGMNHGLWSFHARNKAPNLPHLIPWLFLIIFICGFNRKLSDVMFFLMFFSQRDPAEEALKSNNMNLDQAMSKCVRVSVCVCIHVNKTFFSDRCYSFY